MVRKRTGLAARLALLAALCASPFAPPAPAGEGRPLSVRLASPRGDCSDLGSIDVLFSEPMIPPEERGEESERGPIEFEPSLRGRFRWLGVTAVSFEPDAPPDSGTEIRCRIPGDTRSLRGSRLDQPFVWTIDYRRPELLASLPPSESPGEAEPLHPRRDPILLEFSEPVAERSVRGVELVGPEGTLPLERIEPTPADLRALGATRAGGAPDPDRVVALRPESWPAGPARVELRVTPELRFKASRLSLPEEARIPFRLAGPFEILDAQAGRSGIDVLSNRPVEPDSLRRYLRLTPAPGRLSISTLPTGPPSPPSAAEASHRIRIDGNFRPGSPVDLVIDAGLPDLAGERTKEPYSYSLRFPHAPALLEIVPRGAAVPSGTGSRIEIHARNVGPVSIRGAWVDEAELLDVLALREGAGKAAGGPSPAGLAWVLKEAWPDPSALPDSLCLREERPEEMRGRPAGALAFWVEASAPRLIRGQDAAPDSLFTSGLINLSSLGISSWTGPERTLIWVTDLSSGKPVSGATVTLRSARVSGTAVSGASGGSSIGRSPIWENRTDGDGLAWGPGPDPGGDSRVLFAESKGRRAWLQVRAPEPDAASAPTLHAAFVLDRARYRPGEAIRWKAFVRRETAAGIEAPSAGDLRVRIEGPECFVLAAAATLDAAGDTEGTLALPADAAPGEYQIRLSPAGSAPDPVPLRGSRRLWVDPALTAPFEMHVAAEIEQGPEAGPRLRARGSWVSRGGHPLAHHPIRWTAGARRLDWRAPGWEEFVFGDLLDLDAPGPGTSGSEGSRPAQESAARESALRESAPSSAAQDIGPGETPGSKGARARAIASGELHLDDEGRMDLEVPRDPEVAASDQRISLELESAAPGLPGTATRTEADLVRGGPRAGIHAIPPESDRTRSVAWEWVVVDTAGRVLPGTEVTAELLDLAPAVDRVVATRQLVSGAQPAQLALELPGPGSYALRLTPRGGPDAVSPAALAPSATAAGSGGSPVRLAEGNSEAEPGSPAVLDVSTPPGGAYTLLVLENADPLRARVERLRGSATVEMDLGTDLPAAAVVTALEVGPAFVAVDSTSRILRASPGYAVGSAPLEIGRGSRQAQVELLPSRRRLAPGDTLDLAIQARDPRGRSLEGTVTLAVADARSVEGDDPEANDLVQVFRAPPPPRAAHDDVRQRLLGGTDARTDPPARGPVEDPSNDPVQVPAQGPAVNPTQDPAQAPVHEPAETSSPYRSPAPAGNTSDASPERPPSSEPDEPISSSGWAYWNPAIPLQDGGRAAVSIPMPRRPGEYRIRAWVSSPDGRFGFAESGIAIDDSLGFADQAPAFARPGDRWELAARLHNGSREGRSVRVRLELEGGVAPGSPERTQTLAPGQSTTLDFDVSVPEEGEVEQRYRCIATEEHGEIETVERTVPILGEGRRRAEVTFGRAAPSSETLLDLAAPDLLEADKVTIQIAPSVVSGVADALDGLIEDPTGSTEAEVSRLFALQARQTWASALPGSAVPEEDAKGISRGIAELARRWTGTGFSMWPHPSRCADENPEPADVASRYLNAYAYWTLAELRAAGYEIPETMWNPLEESLAAKVGELGEEPQRDDLVLGAFAAWLRLEHPSYESPLDLVDLERYFSRRDALGPLGRIFLGLAYHALLASESTPEVVQEIHTRQETLLDLFSQDAAAAMERGYLEANASSPALPFSSAPGDRIRMTSFAVLWLSREAVDHPLLPTMVNWLLDQRRAGRWPNPHEDALAVRAILDYARHAEVLGFPIQGRIVLGVTRSRGARFTKEDPKPKRFDFTLEDLSRLRRPEESDTRLPVRCETDGSRPLYYQVRAEREIPAAARPAREEGLVVSSRWLSADRARPLDHLDQGQPALREVEIVLAEDAERLVVEDPLFPGVEVLDPLDPLGVRAAGALRPPEGNRFALPAGAWSVEPDQLIVYSDRVRAGVYRLDYWVLPAVRGEFTSPGPQARRLYRPGVRGAAGAESLIVE